MQNGLNNLVQSSTPTGGSVAQDLGVTVDTPCSLQGDATSNIQQQGAPVDGSSGAEKLNRVNLKDFIKGQDGKFVSVDFVKVDGSARTLTGRLGVHSYLKGGRNLVERIDRPYLTVFDVGLCQYRAVNLATVSGIRAQGRRYCVD